MEGRKDIVELLLAHGAEVNKDEDFVVSEEAVISPTTAGRRFGERWSGRHGLPEGVLC